MKFLIFPTIILGLTCLASGHIYGQDKKDKDKEKEKKKEEKYKEKDRKHEYESKDKRDHHNENEPLINIEINLPKIPNPFPNPFPGTPPRYVTNVPPGHYPPPGECRIWYPEKPPGHQPPPQSCSSLKGVRLSNGAFILHGDKGYDSEYDWWEYEKRYPGSVAEVILDILFPRRRR